jgi:hypothetical protein
MNCLYSTCRLTLIPDGWLPRTKPHSGSNLSWLGISTGESAWRFVFNWLF